MEDNKLNEHYESLLDDNGFIPVEHSERFCSAGKCWKLSPKVGDGYYWIYSQQDLFDIKIHDFSYHEDFFLDYISPECLSITLYDSISGEELNPYRRLCAGCIKTFVGGNKPYKALIHKKIPIRSVGIEITPAYYENYLKKRFPNEYTHPLSAFMEIDQTMDFPAMSKLLHEVRNYRGTGISADLFYEGKVSEALSLVLQEQERLSSHRIKQLSEQDILHLENVTAYINDHYAFDLPLDRLSKIACMGSTKLKTTFKQFHGCTITEYIQQRRMSQAEHLLINTDFTMGQIAKMIGYSTSSRFAELFKKNTGILPVEYRKISRQ